MNFGLIAFYASLAWFYIFLLVLGYELLVRRYFEPRFPENRVVEAEKQGAADIRENPPMSVEAIQETPKATEVSGKRSKRREKGAQKVAPELSFWCQSPACRRVFPGWRTQVGRPVTCPHCSEVQEAKFPHPGRIEFVALLTRTKTDPDGQLMTGCGGALILLIIALGVLTEVSENRVALWLGVFVLSIISILATAWVLYRLGQLIEQQDIPRREWLVFGCVLGGCLGGLLFSCCSEFGFFYPMFAGAVYGFVCGPPRNDVVQG